MVIKQNVQQLEKLKLPAMTECYQRQLSDPSIRDWDFHQLLAQILDAQVHHDEQKRLERFIRNAKLRIRYACTEDLDLNPTRGLDKSYIANLNTLQWIDYFQNLILTGATGTGKTYFVCAYAMECIRRGMPVLYKRLSDLMAEIALADRMGTKPKLMTRLQKPRLLILDDWGLSPMTDEYAGYLFDIVESRSERGSIAITAQLEMDLWHSYLGGSTIADAILDRLVHRAHVLKLKGESMRRKRKDSTQENTHV